MRKVVPARMQNIVNYDSNGSSLTQVVIIEEVKYEHDHEWHPLIKGVTLSMDDAITWTDTYFNESAWPSEIKVRFVLQEIPLLEV